ncbi:DDE-type integrase/transposase/recombinase, partial [Shigella sp. FC1655]|uniref:DDE-type integrase/transposase/recombinase n=1 Tax=Shigella sp. FC1655 TaxID=1898038 RepID=UPI0025700C53
YRANETRQFARMLGLEPKNTAVRSPESNGIAETFALDCCDREALHWAVTTGGFDSETVQDVMLGAVERRFGNELPASPVEWLTDNGSCYRANETRQFARMLGLEPKNTAVRSPESNGIAE